MKRIGRERSGKNNKFSHNPFRFNFSSHRKSKQKKGRNTSRKQCKGTFKTKGRTKDTISILGAEKYQFAI